MAFDTTQLTDYAWTDIAKAAKTAMMTAALGGANLTVNNRTIGRISIEDAKALFLLAQEMIAIESAGEAGFGNILVNLQREE